MAQRDIAGPVIYLKIEAMGQDYSFHYAEKPGSWQLLQKNADGRILSSDVAKGYVGTYIGLYASSCGLASDNSADFDWFEYAGREP